MSVEATSANLETITNSRRVADQEIERAINSLNLAYKEVVAAAGACSTLNGEPSEAPGPMSEMADYLAMAREVLAEMSAALIALHPNSGKRAVLVTGRPSTFENDLRNGLTSMRLARWETETLNELAVKVLAGNANAKAGQ